MIVDSLWHFPIKGLEGACRDTVYLEAGQHFPDDRTFAIGNGHARHAESAAGAWHKKAFFLQQMTRLKSLQYEAMQLSIIFFPNGMEHMKKKIIIM